MLSCTSNLQHVTIGSSRGRESVDFVASLTSALVRPRGSKATNKRYATATKPRTSSNNLQHMPLVDGDTARHHHTFTMSSVPQPNTSHLRSRGSQGVAPWQKAPSHSARSAHPFPLHLIRWPLLHAKLLARQGALINASSAVCISLGRIASSLLPLPLMLLAMSRLAGTFS